MARLVKTALGIALGSFHKERYLVVLSEKPYEFGVLGVYPTDWCLSAWICSLVWRAANWFEGVEDLYLVTIVDRNRTEEWDEPQED